MSMGAAQHDTKSAGEAAAAAPEEIGLGQLWDILWPERRTIAAIVAACAVLAAIVSLTMTKTWRAEAVLMPVEESGDLLQTSLGALPAFARGLGKGGPSSTDRMLTILRSRTLAKEVIDGLQLAPLLAPRDWNEAKKGWKDGPPAEQRLIDKLRKDHLSADVTKLGAIKIEVDFRDPDTAVRIAQAYVDRLSVFVHETSITRAKKTRLFLDKQIGENEARLKEAEATLLTFSEDSRRVVLDRATAALVVKTSDLMTDIASKEVARLVMENLLPPDDPRLQGVREEIARRRAELGEGTDVGGGEDRVSLPFEKVPALTLEYGRLKQKIYILQQVQQLLQEEFEKTRIKEASEELTFQVIDAPSMPDRPVRPKKTLIVAFATVASAAAACLFVLLRARLRPRRRDRAAA